MSRTPAVDRTLALTAALLVCYGLLVLYSAGQTDVATRAAGVWYRQFVWVGIGLVVAALAVWALKSTAETAGRDLRFDEAAAG